MAQQPLIEIELKSLVFLFGSLNNMMQCIGSVYAGFTRHVELIKKLIANVNMSRMSPYFRTSPYFYVIGVNSNSNKKGLPDRSNPLDGYG